MQYKSVYIGGMTYGIISGVTALLAGLLVLLFPWEPSLKIAIVTGILAIIAGVMLAAMQPVSWGIVVSFIILGIYTIARATGRIDHQLLRFGFGIGSIVLGVLILVYTFTRKSDKNIS